MPETQKRTPKTCAEAAISKRVVELERRLTNIRAMVDGQEIPEDGAETVSIPYVRGSCVTFDKQRRGYIPLPEEAINEFGLEQGDPMYAIRNSETGRWELRSEEEVHARLFSIPGEDT
jgi:hypothetical protein